MSDIRAAFKAGGVEVIALCDVDSKHLDDSADEVEKLQGSRPKTFKHYQELLETPGLSAVIIATPPQWHALPFLAAIEKNLDIYCEKPLAYDIREGRAMVDAAKKKNPSSRSASSGDRARPFSRSATTSGKAISGASSRSEPRSTTPPAYRTPRPRTRRPRSTGTSGAARRPRSPTRPQVGHITWRLEKTTGHGHLVDWGIHLIDATRYILGETTPRSVQASGGIYYFKDKITTPDILSVQFDFAACPVLWQHRIWGAQEYTPEVANGIFFYGENGTVFVTDNRWVVIPKDKNKERIEHKADADMGTAHMAEFLDAVRTRKPAGCTVEDGYRSTATVKLAMIAYDTGAKVVWDEKSEQIVGNPAAAGLLKRPYRAPWKHPYQGQREVR